MNSTTIHSWNSVDGGTVRVIAQADVTRINEGNKAVMQQALDTLQRVDCVDRDCDILSLSLFEAVEESIAALREAIRAASTGLT